MNDEIRIMIVEDQEPVREGLRVLINGSEGYRCIAACRTAEEALDCIGDELPDVVLMDLVMPGMDGAAATQQIRKKCPRTEVIALTSFKEREQVESALIRNGWVQSRAARELGLTQRQMGYRIKKFALQCP